MTTTTLILFASSFALVFGLGLQSLNVNGGHYMAAAVTSLLIGAMQMVTLQLGPNAGAVEIAGYLAGGPFAIVASMWFHRHVKQWMTDAAELERVADLFASPPRPAAPINLGKIARKEKPGKRFGIDVEDYLRGYVWWPASSLQLMLRAAEIIDREAKLWQARDPSFSIPEYDEMVETARQLRLIATTQETPS